MSLTIRSSVAAILLASVALSAPTSKRVAGPPTVTLASGALIGTQTILPSATAAVNKFLGVPFAQSPPERFLPPQSPHKWINPLTVTEWRPSCIQEFVCTSSDPVSFDSWIDNLQIQPRPKILACKSSMIPLRKKARIAYT